MPRFNITIQALLKDNNSGPHFQIQIEASSYLEALIAAGPHLERVLNEAGLEIAGAAAAKPAAAVDGPRNP